MQETVSVGKAAKALGVCVATIRNWIRAGHISASRLPNGHFRIPVTEIDRLLGRAL